MKRVRLCDWRAYSQSRVVDQSAMAARELVVDATCPAQRDG